jgi:hypothetical protein
MTVIKQLEILHQTILSVNPNNVTRPRYVTSSVFYQKTPRINR